MNSLASNEVTSLESTFTSTLTENENQADSAVDTTLEEIAKLHAIDKELAKVQEQTKV